MDQEQKASVDRRDFMAFAAAAAALGMGAAAAAPATAIAAADGPATDFTRWRALVQSWRYSTSPICDCR